MNARFCELEFFNKYLLLLLKLAHDPLTDCICAFGDKCDRIDAEISNHFKKLRFLNHQKCLIFNAHSRFSAIMVLRTIKFTPRIYTLGYPILHFAFSGPE